MIDLEIFPDPNRRKTVPRIEFKLPIYHVLGITYQAKAGGRSRVDLARSPPDNTIPAA